VAQSDVRFEETAYGFNYGAAEVTRIHSDNKKGWVILGLSTPKTKRMMQIYVTKTGKVRIHDENGEWTKPEKRKTND
jgi:hypothetical protein